MAKCRDVHLRVYIDEPADLLERLASIETALAYLMRILSKEDTVTTPTQPDPTQPDPNQPNPVDDGEPEPAQPTPAQ
jgi:hypothetical protein